MTKHPTRTETSKLLIEDVVEPAPIRSRSFAQVYPQAAKLWTYKKNCGFSPKDFSHCSAVHAWFKCPRGPDHLFQIRLSSMGLAIRNKSWCMGCGFCRGVQTSVTNSLAARYPELAKEWLVEKNGCRPNEISFGASKMAWWKCRQGHQWKARVFHRTTNGTGCPKCRNRGQATIDLSRYPNALKEFDKTKNKGVNPHALPVGVDFYWNCRFNRQHSWEGRFSPTMKPNRCPFCFVKTGTRDNNLKKSHPDLAKQWHTEKNGLIKPTEVTATNRYTAWWKCINGPDHEWQAKIVNRVYGGSGCPFCANKKVSVTNAISTQAPQLVKEWHAKKNGKVGPDQETVKSRKKYWWKCSQCSHEWRTSPYSRAEHLSGCPRCVQLRLVKKLNDERADSI